MEIHFSDTKPIKMGNVLVEAWKNGVKQKMTINQSKWTASWNETNCQYCHSHTQCSQCGVNPVTSIGFVILIDLTPGSLKKGSLHVLDHLLNLWKTKTLADVEF
jgi:hypothetical protein